MAKERDLQDARDKYLETVRTMQECEYRTGHKAAIHHATARGWSPQRIRRFKQEIQPSLTRRYF